jgi:DNA-binding CsgD family transcriptional regulator
VTPSPLTRREEQVRSLAAHGLPTDEIARRLAISKRTVEAHLRNVFQKLGVTRRDQLAAAAERPTASAAIGVEAALDLKADNERLSRQVSSYDAAMRQLIDRQFPLFEESVEITVTVGGFPGEDLVVERHRTKPKPYLVYRVARPIMLRRSPVPPFDDLGLTCEVVGQDMGVAVQPVLEPHDRLLVLVFFQPGLKETTEWVLRYRTPGRWDELRAEGQDTLVWSTSTLDSASTPGIGDVTFYFDLPGEDVTVTQRHQTGDFKEDRLPGGGTRVTWHNFVPGRHEWTLRTPARPREPQNVKP